MSKICELISSFGLRVVVVTSIETEFFCFFFLIIIFDFDLLLASVVACGGSGSGSGGVSVVFFNGIVVAVETIALVVSVNG